MNKDIFQGDWNMVKGKIKEQWGKLTDDDLTQIKGKRDQLLGKLQQRYGFARDKAEQEIQDFEATCDEECKATSGSRSSKQNQNWNQNQNQNPNQNWNQKNPNQNQNR